MMEVIKSHNHHMHNRQEELRPSIGSEEIKELAKEIWLNLKQLPSHLKYIFLDEKDEFLATMSECLNTLEEDKLFKILH